MHWCVGYSEVCMATAGISVHWRVGYSEVCMATAGISVHWRVGYSEVCMATAGIRVCIGVWGIVKSAWQLQASECALVCGV